VLTLGAAALAAPLKLSQDPTTITDAAKDHATVVATKENKGLVHAGLVLSVKDVLNILKIMVKNIILVAISGAIAGHFLFKLLAYQAVPVKWYFQIPADLLFAVIGAYLGALRGVGSSLTYFVERGLVTSIITKNGKKNDAAVVNWDETVNHITSGLRAQAAGAFFLTRPLWNLIARKMETLVILVKAEKEYVSSGSLTLLMSLLIRSITKEIRKRLNTPLYVAGGIYGLAMGGIALLVHGK